MCNPAAGPRAPRDRRIRAVASRWPVEEPPRYQVPRQRQRGHLSDIVAIANPLWRLVCCVVLFSLVDAVAQPSSRPA
jgi:hypothetical protein